MPISHNYRPEIQEKNYSIKMCKLFEKTNV